jgi:hypothetical protein
MAIIILNLREKYQLWMAMVVAVGSMTSTLISKNTNPSSRSSTKTILERSTLAKSTS